MPEPAALPTHQHESQMRTRIKTIRLVAQVFGAIVCILFIVQGVLVFANTTAVTDFWHACRWIAEALLSIIIGVLGCFLECHVWFKGVRQNCGMFAVNRLLLASVYIW